MGLGLLLVANASMAQIVVTPTDTEAWIDRGTNTGTLGLGIADNNGGTSSLLLSTDGSPSQIIRASRIPLAPFLAITIDQVTSVSWDFYTDNAANYPRPQLEYFGSGVSGTLVYETGNLTPALNTWQSASVDFGADTFRDTRDNSIQTLDAHKAAIAAAATGPVLMNYFQFGYGSTSGSFAATTAYLDNPGLNGTTWDFEDVVVLPPEPAPPAVPAPTMSQWALITLAMLLAGVVFIRRKQLS